MKAGFLLPPIASRTRQRSSNCLQLAVLESANGKPTMTEPGDTSTAFQDLPLHLQHLVFVSAAAPLTTCSASAAIAEDASLVAEWLLAKRKWSLLTASKHQLWDVCDLLVNTYQYTPDMAELHAALPLAAQSGRASLVGCLLKWCCKEHHSRCETCRSVSVALTYAAAKGDLPICSLLDQHPAVGAQEARTAVCEAATAGQNEVLQFLLSSRTDASTPGLDGSPMCCAAEGGHVAAMQLLVLHGADINHTRGSPWSGDSWNTLNTHPLRYAASKGHTEMIRWMLSQGVPFHYVEAALVDTSRKGDITGVHSLLGISPEVVAAYGSSALSTSLVSKKVELIPVLLEAGVPFDNVSLMQAAQVKDVPYLKEWVKTHVVFECMWNGLFPVIYQAAVKHGQAEFAHMLLSQAYTCYD